MFLIFWLGYLTRDIFFMFHPFDWKFPNSIFPSCVLFRWIKAPYLLSSFFSWGASRCFRVLAITNNAATNIVEEMSLLHGYGSFGYIPRRELPRPVVDWFPFSWGTAILTFKMAVQVCTPNSIGGVFPFLLILSNGNCHWVFNFSPSGRSTKMVTNSLFTYYLFAFCW